MTDTIKLLEELVVEAADRLRALTSERDELRQEVGALRERLDARRNDVRDSREAQEGRELASRHARTREVLAEALAELRGGGDAA